MTSKSFKVGLLGAGYIVDSHAKALRAIPGVELAAVCDRSLGRAEAVGQRYGISSVTDDLAKMLQAPIDAVHILLPPDAHAWGARKVLEAGKHVLLEKPMGVSAAECHALVNLSRKGPGLLGVSHNFLFGRGYEKLRQDIRSGVFGPIDHLTVNWLFPLGFVKHGPFDNWMLRETRNTFIETGPHLLAFVFDLLGGMDDIRAHVAQPVVLPTGVTVYRKWSVTAQYGPTTISVNLAMTDGHSDRSLRVRARAGTAVCNFERDLYIKNFPENQNPVFDNVLSSLSELRQHGGAAAGNFVRAVRGTLAKSAALNPYTESFQRSVGAFYESLAKGQMDPRLNGEIGAQVLAACESIARAAGVPVDANPGPNTRLTAQSMVTAPAKSPEVLVLGGSGFIGRHLVGRLVAKGLAVRVASRNALAAAINLQGLEVDVVQGPIGDPAFLRTALEGIHTVYHLAKTDGKNWAHYQQHEVEVTKTIAKACEAAKVRRFIYTGTIDSYDSADPSVVINNSTPVDANIVTRNHYARSKAVSEGILMDLHRSSAFPAVILRPGVVIGKGCPPAHWGVGMFVSESYVTYWGDGHNKIPLVLVEDVADALVRAYDRPGIEGQTLLVTDGPLLSAREYVAEVSRLSGMYIEGRERSTLSYYLEDVAKEVLKHLSKHPNRRPPSKHDWACRALKSRFDSSDTERALGWKPQGTREALIEQGVRAAVEDAYR